jgi:hypothetical protein
MILSEFHNAFNGVFWRVSEKGIELKDGGLISFVQFSPRTVATATKYAAEYTAASKISGVPVELIVACSLTEGAIKNFETCVREEPGYVSDEATPGRISAGCCQLLLSTARQAMHDQSIGTGGNSPVPNGNQSNMLTVWPAISTQRWPSRMRDVGAALVRLDHRQLRASEIKSLGLDH